MKHLLTLLVICSFGQRPIYGQREANETTWPTLFRLFHSNHVQRLQLTRSAGYFEDKKKPPCINFSYQIAGPTGKWFQKLRFCPDSREVWYMTENDVHFDDLRRELQEVHGFEERKSGGDSIQVFALDSALIEMRSRETTENMVAHFIHIKRMGTEDSIRIKPEWERPRYHALLIGMQNYRPHSSWPALKWPHENVDSLAQVLTRRYGFDCKVLKDTSRAAIFKAFDGMRNYTSNDHLLVFYAGHGDYDKSSRTGYWVPTDASDSDRSKHVSSRDIVALIKALHVGHLFLISDACFGGSIFQEEEEYYTPSAEDWRGDIKAMFSKPSRIVSTSGDLEEVPDESLYFKALIDILKSNNSPNFKCSSLVGQIVDRIEQARADSEDLKIPLPQFGRLMYVGDRKGCFTFRLSTDP